MSFSDDGWGMGESEVKVAVEQRKAEQTLAIANSSLVITPKLHPKTETPVKVFPKLETIEEHLNETVTPVTLSDVSATGRCSTPPARGEPVKDKTSLSDDASDDGWGSPKKEGFRGPIISKNIANKLPTKFLQQPTPVPVNDTLDIDSPRSGSPLPEVEVQNSASIPETDASSFNNGIHNSTESFGKSFGTQKQFGSDSFGTKPNSVASPQEKDDDHIPTSLETKKSFGSDDFGTQSKTLAPYIRQENSPQIPKSFGAQKLFGSDDFGSQSKTIVPHIQQRDSAPISKMFGSQKLSSPDSFEASAYAKEDIGSDHNKTSELSAKVPNTGGTFGGQKRSSEFVENSLKPSGLDGSKTVGFGENFGASKTNGLEFVKPSSFETPKFGNIKTSGFGENLEDYAEVGIHNSVDDIKPRNPSSKFGSESSNFKQVDSSAGLTKQFGFGGVAKSTGSSSFGGTATRESRSLGISNMPERNEFIAQGAGSEIVAQPAMENMEGRTNRSFGFGKSVRFGEESRTFKTSSFGVDSTNKLGGFGAQSSHFGHSSSSTGFGDKFDSSSKQSGFGIESISNRNSTLGGTKAGSSSFGFGCSSNTSGGKSTVGDVPRCSFGGNSSSGFGEKGISGFKVQPNAALDSSGSNNAQTEKSAFSSFGQFKKDDGFGGENSKRDSGWGRDPNNSENDRPRGCHNCGEDGHFSRECEKPKQPRPCRNCNELGHFSKDCDKPKIPFGPCRNCQTEGHFAKDCKEERVRTEPTEPCRRCNEEGHWSSECPTRPRDLQGNVLVPYDVVFTPEEVMFEEAVNNDARINFDQVVVASMGENEIPDVATFDGFKILPHDVHDNLKRMKMNRPTPIQRAAFYQILHGRDVVACAHTGSGKTLAFLLPLVINLLEDRVHNHNVTDVKPSPRLLIVAPTRELANQTFNTARQLTYQTGLKCGLAYGGYSRSANLQHLRGFDQLGILVATMGRLQDFLESGDITLEKMKFVVLDEADRMVDCQDFGEEVCKVIGSSEERTQQTILFSASFSEKLQAEDLPKIVKEGYIMLQVDKFGTANENIDQQIFQVPRTEKRTELYKLLGFDENTMSVLPDARIEKEKTLIFVNSVKFCDTLASNIANCGVSCISMHSHQNQEQRDRTLDDFRHGKYQCMVASNVCARGLNIAGLDHVVNYDMPDKNGFDEYVNRIGRTARAGFLGASTAFVDEESDREIIPCLITVLTEAKKAVPEWLVSISDQGEEANDAEEDEQW